ncbi:hypothetical protein OVW19_27900, partial [Klebsiella pneumoniae]|uniref:hypothetical protein n=1 Tax=Klebsiella pneumoniae TaxID=573 RepID=UPI00226E02F7
DNGQLLNPGAETVGRDFFLDVARFENRGDLRRHFRNFITSARSVDNFAFDCVVGGEVVKTKINMTRAREYDYDHTDGIVILDIKQAGS